MSVDCCCEFEIKQISNKKYNFPEILYLVPSLLGLNTTLASKKRVKIFEMTLDKLL
jgi:hypothetical protein